MAIPLKVAVVGPPMGGKSSLLLALTTGAICEEHTPTTFDNYAIEMEESGKKFDLRLWDTGADKKQRANAYESADMVLICFPVTDEEDNIETFFDEAQQACPQNTFLIGLKTDLQVKKEESVIKITRGQELAEKHNVIEYLECSAKTNNSSVKDIFQRILSLQGGKKQEARERKGTNTAWIEDESCELKTLVKNFAADQRHKIQPGFSTEHLEGIRSHRLVSKIGETPQKPQQKLFSEKDISGLSDFLDLVNNLDARDPGAREEFQNILMHGSTSKLFKVEKDETACKIMTMFEPEVWKIESKLEGREENLLHHFINQRLEGAIDVLLECDHPHLGQLIFEKAGNGNTPLMSSINQDMEKVNEKIWSAMQRLKPESFKMEDFLVNTQSKISVLTLCAENSYDELLEKICESIESSKRKDIFLLNTRGGRTVIDMCKKEDTLLKILDLLDLGAQGNDLCYLDMKDKNVLHYWCGNNFKRAIERLKNNIEDKLFTEMLFQKSKNQSTPMMAAALKNQKDSLEYLLFHLHFTENKEELDNVLHHTNKYENTLLALVLEQGCMLEVSKQILLEMEKKYHKVENGKDQNPEGRKEFAKCMEKHLKPSVDVQKALNIMNDGLPKESFKKVIIWIKVFLKSLLIPVCLLLLDVGFDVALVDRYSDWENMEKRLSDSFDFCRNNSQIETDDVATECYLNQTGSHYVCIPLGLNMMSRYYYSLAFVLSPWLFYYIEYCQSKYWEKFKEEVPKLGRERGCWSREFITNSILHFLKAAALILIWPVWSHIQKFKCEGLYLTSYGIERVKARKRFLENTIVSSRAQIIEICSEATFQPLLQLYLLFPMVLCFDYSSLANLKAHALFEDVSKLQFWSILTSCLSLSWSFNAYQASRMTGALDFGSNMSGRLVLLASCVCQISSRLFTFILLAYCFGDGLFWPMVVLVLIHMLLMALIHFLTSKSFRTRRTFLLIKWKWLQVFYQCLLNGISNLYLYNNILPLQSDETAVKLKSGTLMKEKSAGWRENIVEKTKYWREVIVDSIIVLETLIIVITASFQVEDLPAWLPLAVISVHLFGLLLKFIYHYFLHIWSDTFGKHLQKPNWCKA